MVGESWHPGSRWLLGTRCTWSDEKLVQVVCPLTCGTRLILRLFNSAWQMVALLSESSVRSWLVFVQSVARRDKFSHLARQCLLILAAGATGCPRSFSRQKASGTVHPPYKPRIWQQNPDILSTFEARSNAKKPFWGCAGPASCIRSKC